MGRMKDFLQRTVSRAAATVNLPSIRTNTQPQFTVTNKAGKPGTPYRRIVKHVTVGACHRQVGIRWLHGECHPLMQAYTPHSFLHATKGWRTYTGGGLPALGHQRKPNLPRNPAPSFRAHRSGAVEVKMLLPAQKASTYAKANHGVQLKLAA